MSAGSPQLDNLTAWELFFAGLKLKVNFNPERKKQHALACVPPSSLRYCPTKTGRDRIRHE
jgi:hypothetical protein